MHLPDARIRMLLVDGLDPDLAHAPRAQLLDVGAAASYDRAHLAVLDLERQLRLLFLAGLITPCGGEADTD